VALLLQRRKAVRVAGEDLGSFVAAREARVVPRVVRALPEVGAARVLGAIALALIALGIPFLTSNAHTILFAFIAIYAIIGLSLVVLTGWAGQVSLGQFAFVGLGAATTGSLLVHTGWDLVFCLLASCACGAVAAIIIGVPALRVPGLFLAAVTLAFAVPTSTYFLNSQYFPTLTPLRVTSPILFDRFDLGEPRVLYYFCLSGLVIAMLLVRNFRRSRIGRAVIAARDNERLASAFSVATVRVKLIAFAVSGGLAGLAGGLYVLAIRGIPFGGFSPDLSVQLFTMVVVGGLTSITGAIVGALYVYFAQYFLTGAAQLLATGAGLLVILLIAPGGLAEILYRARDRVLRRVVSRREMDVPGFYDVRSGSREADQPTAPVDAGTAPAHDGSAELLTCARVCAAYGHLQVLFGVDLSVPDGSIVAMLGTNGAGKTTILKTIVGLLPPTGGRIIFDGVDVTQLDPIDRVRRGLVMVPAKAVFGSLTVRENLRLAGWIPRREGDHAYLETTTRRVFDLFPVLEERLDQQASLLSGGEQQMLALAQGLLARPRLLLVDELSLGLAPVAVSAIFRVVRELNKAGLPVVVVEQSINASASIAPDAVFIEKGEVRFSGPTEDLAAEGSLVRSVFFGEAGRDVPTRVRPTVRASVNGNSQRGATRPVFSARGITKTYGAVTAIADVDLDIYAGQILGIIGANGAGKTTAFDIFSGFTGPDHGTMLYDGADVTRASAAERAALGFGRTFQDVRLLPSLTTAETLAVSLERNVEVREPVACLLYFDATARSERSVRRRVDELLETFGLERYRDTFVADLSTGTRRVLELACAAGHRPNLLLLDEPSSGLSLAESDAMAQHLVELASSTGATLAIIEHDVPLVSRLSDELVCMDLGRIVARGKPAAVLADPVVIRSYLGGEEGTFGASVGGPIRKKEAPKAARAAKTTAVPTGRSR
jgi:ABC-type branched-subunit amino acid transport system ATPase component/ABC-type branched-subunit amino acid transport system permease subunit